jgi:hypothetical protein
MKILHDCEQAINCWMFQRFVRSLFSLYSKVSTSFIIYNNTDVALSYYINTNASRVVKIAQNTLDSNQKGNCLGPKCRLALRGVDFVSGWIQNDGWNHA